MNKYLAFLIILALSVIDIHAQQRDRRADLNISCYLDYAVSPSGRLWIATRCGMIYTADNIHSTWRTVKSNDDDLSGKHYERVAPVDEKTAVVAGFLSPGYNYVVRTTSSGMWWDTVTFDKRDHWVHGMYYDESGRIWMSSALGRSRGAIIYSDDKGASFKVLNNKIPDNSGVDFITMVDADSGMAGTYYNQILTTSDNWKTINLMPTPMDQLMADDKEGRREIWVTRIQPWNHIVIASQGGESYYTDKNKIEWKKTPFAIRDYMLDDKGWYRICRPGGVESIKPAKDNDESIIVSQANGKMFLVDTAGRMTSFRLEDPLRDFTEKGIQNLIITTYKGGCYHYETHEVVYRRLNGDLCEVYNSVDSGRLLGRMFPAVDVEKALRRLGQNYDINPTAADFGLEDTTVDVNSILKALFTCYQPCLWQALKPMMPEKMMLRNYLDNNTIKPPFYPQSGDLFFVRDRESDMEKAITASTGQYTHVAMAELDTLGQLWIIEATTQKGVQRVKFGEWTNRYGAFEIYRLKVPFDVDAVLRRAKSFIGQPYDDNFLPDNGKMYCSELIYEAFLDSAGNHLFQSQPMVFRDKKGRMPRYWKRHFRKLGQPVPENVPGTNPTDMSHSPILEKVF